MQQSLRFFRGVGFGARVAACFCKCSNNLTGVGVRVSPFNAYSVVSPRWQVSADSRSMVMLTRQEALAELGVTEGVNDAEVRAAYKKLAREWHPDKNPSDGATEKFQRVNAAYHRITQGGLDNDKDYHDFAEEDTFEFFEMFFFRGRAPPPRGRPSPWATGGGGCGSYHAFPGGGIHVFMFSRGGRGPAPAAQGGTRGGATYEENCDDDDGNVDVDDDFDEEDRDFYDLAREAAAARAREVFPLVLNPTAAPSTLVATLEFPP